MKRIYFLSLLLGILSFSPTFAQGSKHMDTNKIKVNGDSAKNEQISKVKTNTEMSPKPAKDSSDVEDAPKRLPLGETANIIVVICFFIVTILLLICFFRHIKDNRQRIGFQSIKFIGLALIFPGICILAIVGGSNVLSGQTLAVLLGTIAGYVLSKDDDSKDNSRDFNKMKDDFEKKEKVAVETIKKLEEQLKSIRAKNPGLID